MIFQVVLCCLIVSAYSSPLMTDRSEQGLAEQAMLHGAVMEMMPISASFVGGKGRDRAVADRPEGAGQGGGREKGEKGKGKGGKGKDREQGQGREQ